VSHNTWFIYDVTVNGFFNFIKGHIWNSSLKNVRFCRDSTEEVKGRTSEAKSMLQVWKKSYFEVRAKIEQSGRDQRWEFDRKKLFERTDYMSAICQDLYNVAQVG